MSLKSVFAVEETHFSRLRTILRFLCADQACRMQRLNVFIVGNED